MDYAERLTVPLRWWVQGTMLVASLWLAVLAATPRGRRLVGDGRRAGRPGRPVRRLRRARGCRVDGTTSGPVGRTSRSSTSGRGDGPRRGRRTTPGGRRRRRPGVPAAAALPQARACGWTSPTRPTRRRTGWSAAADPTPLVSALEAGADPASCWVGWPHGLSHSNSKLYSAFSLVAALGAAAVAKKGLNTSWRAATGKNPPGQPGRPRRRHRPRPSCGPPSAAP